ncbi:hypothetical protein T02_8176 [Trichinella nativa]|uniref:Uncharacterized protein n=1 Tax=Trichinella nativa TaxID=6335 RepID=A0A0V1L0H3_9BILA|nr:hypothetical protein T02_8176 [Trichinella nativa]
MVRNNGEIIRVMMAVNMKKGNSWRVRIDRQTQQLRFKDDSSVTSHELFIIAISRKNKMLRSDDDEEGGGGVIQDDGEKENCAGIEIVVSGVLPAAVVWFIAKLIGRSGSIEESEDNIISVFCLKLANSQLACLEVGFNEPVLCISTYYLCWTRIVSHQANDLVMIV